MKLRLVILFLTFSTVLFAQSQTQLNADYRYYDTKGSHHKGSVSAMHMTYPHMFLFNYTQMNDNANYDKNLYDLSAGYIYTEERINAGMMVRSSSDYLFNSIDATNIYAFAAYKVYGTTLGGTGEEGRDNFKIYLGLLGATRQFLGSNIVPYIDIIYQGEILRARLGVVESSLMFIPHPQHMLSFSTNFQGYEVKYAFKPHPSNKISVSYSSEAEDYHIKETGNKFLLFHQDWLRVDFSQYVSSNIELYAGYGYLVHGIVSVDKELKRKKAKTLPYSNELRIGANVAF